jgi:hypothetical protein
MVEFLEILKYTVPALIVFLTAYYMIRMFMKNEDTKRHFELHMTQKDSTLPLRLQAYERLILFLERISPDSIVMRMSQTNLNNVQLQNELVTSVRTEFEHNLAQQIYVSNHAWDQIKTARNNVIKLINEAAAELKPDSSGISLSKKILENAMNMGSSPTQDAIVFLKKEVRELF